MSISHAPPELAAIVSLSTRRTRVPRWLRRTSGPLLLLALWQLLSSTGVLTSDILASPRTIARVGGSLIADGSLPNAMGVSLQRVAVGLLFGTLEPKLIPGKVDFAAFVDTRFNGGLPPSTTTPRVYKDS